MNKKKLFIYILGVALVSITANLVHPVTPTLIVERGLDSSMFGVALAAMQVMYFLTSPFWGRLCDYIPSKDVALICCCGYAIGQFAFACAQNETAVLLGRMFAGCFTGGVFTAMLNYIVNTSNSEQRGKNITIYSTINNVFNAVGYFVGGFLGLISVEVTFYIQCIFLILCGLFFHFFWINDDEFKKKPEHPLTVKDANPFSVFISAKSFMTPLLAILFAMVAIGNLGQTAYDQVFNYYIKDQLGLSSAYNGIFKAIIAALTFIVNSTLVMYLIKKTDTNISVMPIIVSSLIPIALVFFCKTTIPFVSCYIIFLVLAPMRATLLQNIFANKGNAKTSNRIMGFYQSMHGLGGIFGAFFAGIMYKKDPMSPFVFSLIAVLIGVLLSIIYVAVYKKSQKN